MYEFVWIVWLILFMVARFTDIFIYSVDAFADGLGIRSPLSDIAKVRMQQVSLWCTVVLCIVGAPFLVIWLADSIGGNWSRFIR